MGTEAHTFDKAASAALEADLRREVEGPVHFDQANRVMYACDASHYRQVPIGVVAPRSIDDLEAAVAVCRRHGAPSCYTCEHAATWYLILPPGEEASVRVARAKSILEESVALMRARQKLDAIEYMTELRLRHVMRARGGMTPADATLWVYTGAPHAARDAPLFSAEWSLRNALRSKGLPLSDARSWISDLR